MFVLIVVLPLIPICYSIRSGNQLFLADILNFLIYKFYYVVLIALVLSVLLTWAASCWAFYKSAGWLGLRFNLIPLPLGIKEVHRRKQRLKESKMMKFLQRWIPPDNGQIH